MRGRLVRSSQRPPRPAEPVVDGLGMLLHQGRPGFEAWFGAPVQVTDRLRTAMLATLASER